jgi:hypothetical protein
MFEDYLNSVRTILTEILETQESSQIGSVPITVSLAATDASLVPLAKAGFSKLPVPIQNILLAVVEYETLKAKAYETGVGNALLKSILDLDSLLRLVSISTDKIRMSKEDLLAHSRGLWEEELRNLGDPFVGDHPYSSFEISFKRVLETERSELLDSPEIDIKEVPDTSILDARLSLSKAYRKKAEQLYRNELESTTFPDVPHKEEQPLVVRQTKVPEISESLKLQKERLETLRKKAIKLWAPYRASIQQMLSLDIQEMEGLFLDKIAKIQAHDICVASVPEKDLQSEYKFALQAFPCDASMVKLCMTVSLEGAKLRHTRKLLDLKTEYTTQFQVRLKQFQTSILAYKDACTVPLV